MNVYVIASIGLILNFIQNAIAHECSSSESIACGEEIQDLKSESNRYYYASDDKTLDEMCRKQFVAVKCVNSFAEECLPKNERAQFEVMIQGAHKFFNDFCFENGSMRKQYLKHAHCLRSISDELDSCTEKYQAMQKKIDSEVIEGDLLLQKTCCIYFENIRCSENISFSICGNEAADLVTQLLTLLSGTFLSERCKEFTNYDFKSCSLVSKSVVFVPDIILLFLLFLMSHNITFQIGIKS